MKLRNLFFFKLQTHLWILDYILDAPSCVLSLLFHPSV